MTFSLGVFTILYNVIIVNETVKSGIVAQIGQSDPYFFFI